MGVVVCCAKERKKQYGENFRMFMFTLDEPFTQFL